MSDHKHLKVTHRGLDIRISYWIDERHERKIVSWEVRDPTTADIGYGDALADGYVREPLGGRPGILGFGGRPEKSFHELVATAVENGIEWINNHEQDLIIPEPDEIEETLAIRGYAAEGVRADE